MATVKKEKSPFPLYKGFPLVRSKNYIYYGDPREEYVIFLTILETDASPEKIPTRVRVELLLTDESVSPFERSKKMSEKSSLYEALDLGQIWLSRVLDQKA